MEAVDVTYECTRLNVATKKIKASDPKTALAVKTSPSKWTCSITAPKMEAVDVTYKCARLNVATEEEK